MLQLLHVLACLVKPERVLETGTFRGFGTIALALAQNGRGTLTSVDGKPEARRHIHVFDPALLHYVELVEDDASDYLRTYQGRPFGFAFLDSVPARRVAELEILVERGLLCDGMAVVHDSSMPSRPAAGRDFCWEGLDRLERLLRGREGFRFEASRGCVPAKPAARRR